MSLSRAVTLLLSTKSVSFLNPCLNSLKAMICLISYVINSLLNER
uniref:Uncharacterized protein n=1 Tax=Brassica campestris TaxID=3711 RepID=A0A3P5YFJ8_BRACM|nr:unnamed protein product [Brassica rapa]